MEILKGKFRALVAAGVLMAATAGAVTVGAQQSEGVPQPAKAEQLFALANEARAREGRGNLMWDQALADAAMKHCLRMVAEGPIAHQYPGEPDLTARAGQAGAHFSLIEENIAMGAYPGSIQQGWLDSPGHRANLLNPEINRVGVAVVAARGALFAVEDFARGVAVLSPAEVESTVAGLLRTRGIAVRRERGDARAACPMDRGLPTLSGGEPEFVMRWQDSSLDRLPARLVDALASGRYHQAAVGSCPARTTEGSFTAYRVAVLLY